MVHFIGLRVTVTWQTENEKILPSATQPPPWFQTNFLLAQPSLLTESHNLVHAFGRVCLMAPVTRSGGAPTPIVGIKLNPPIIKRALENANETLPHIVAGSGRRIQQLQHIISQESTVHNTQTAYRLLAGLFNDTVTAARTLDSESRLLQGYLQCGDWIHDYVQPYMDAVCQVYPRVKTVEAFLRQWNSQGGLTNGASAESIIIQNTIRNVNPLMTPAQHGNELMTVYNLMNIYQDRCRTVHRNVSHMTEQRFYTFLKETEEKVLNAYYRFRNDQERLCVLRAVQADKNRYYKWDGNGRLEYFRSNGSPTGVYVNP